MTGLWRQCCVVFFFLFCLFLYLWAQSMFIGCHGYKNATVETWIHSSNYPIYLSLLLPGSLPSSKWDFFFFSILPHEKTMEIICLLEAFPNRIYLTNQILHSGDTIFATRLANRSDLPRQFTSYWFCHNYSCRLVHFLFLYVPHSSTDLSVFWGLVKLGKGSMHWRSGKESKATTVYDICVHTTVASDSGGWFLRW